MNAPDDDGPHGWQLEWWILWRHSTHCLDRKSWKSCSNMPKKVVSLCALLSAGCFCARAEHLWVWRWHVLWGVRLKTSLHDSLKYCVSIIILLFVSTPHPVCAVSDPYTGHHNFFSAHDTRATWRQTLCWTMKGSWPKPNERFNLVRFPKKKVTSKRSTLCISENWYLGWYNKVCLHGKA